MFSLAQADFETLLNASAYIFEQSAYYGLGDAQLKASLEEAGLQQIQASYGDDVTGITSRVLITCSSLRLSLLCSACSLFHLRKCGQNKTVPFLLG